MKDAELRGVDVVDQERVIISKVGDKLLSSSAKVLARGLEAQVNNFS